jgi:outer membrane receptor protein involved in Fe transport
LIDPNVGIPQFFPVRAEADPNGQALVPETADVLNLGLSWSITDRLDIGVDYWSFDYQDVIIQQNPQALLNAAAAGNAAAAAQIVRDPLSGLLLRVDSFYANASALETDGFDFNLGYDFELAGGSSVTLGTEATLITSYDLDDPQAGRIDGLGKRNFSNFATSTPELRATVFANFRRGRHGIDVFLRHIDGYEDDQAAVGSPARRIGAFDTIDAQYSWRNDNGVTLAAGAINLSDEDPPHVATNGGYDSKVHDPRGRLLYMRASFDF